jgi:hypothetical protein
MQESIAPEYANRKARLARSERRWRSFFAILVVLFAAFVVYATPRIYQAAERTELELKDQQKAYGR